MTKYFLNNLARHIVTNGGIGKNESRKIAQLLSPGDLRELVSLVRLEEEKATVYVTSFDPLSKKDKEMISNRFQKKKLVEKTDKNMGAGLKARVYDMIYDLSIRSKVESMTRELEEEI